MPALLLLKPLWDFLTGLPWQVWAAIIVTAVAFFGVRAYGDAQRADESQRWQAKIAAAEADWQKQLDAANAANRAREAESAQVIANISTHYQNEVKNAQAQRDADRTAVRGGGLRLFIPANAANRACVPGAGDAFAATSGRDGGATSELPQQITSDLFDLANDANAVAHQLRAAQAVIVEYYKTCGPPAANPP